MIGNKLKYACLLLFSLFLIGNTALADQSTDEIAKYREMIADGNPSELYALKGEQQWKAPRGPKNANLEQCDLGLGAGVVKGAYAKLPKFFKDTNRVQDLESRLMTCMEQLQGIAHDKIVNEKFLKGEKEVIANLVAYIVTESNGDTIQVDTKSLAMQKMYALGEKAFYYRSGPMDFACSTCHGDDNKRIRLQDLPNITTQKGAAMGWGSWPAYRVSNGQFWTMQHRLNDCYRQQRTAEPIYASDVTIALSVYMATKANGGKMLTPGLKR